MREWNGQTYLTLKEYLADTTRYLPFDLTDWSWSESSGAETTMGSRFVARYGRRYLFTADVNEFTDALNEAAKRVRYQFERMMINIRQLESDFVEDGFTSQSERKRPYNGTVSIEQAPTEDAVVVRSSGGSSGNIDRIIRYQNEFKNILTTALDQFAGLFISIESDWGREVTQE